MSQEQSKTSHTPFIIVAILCLVVTVVQLAFNFRGLTNEAAMDQAQIARNVARGQGMVTHVARPFQLMNDCVKAGVNPLLPDEPLKQQDDLLAQSGKRLVDQNKFNPYAVKNTRYAPLNILVESAIFKVVGIHKYDLWTVQEGNQLYTPDRIVAGISALFFILAVLSAYFLLHKLFDTTIASFTCLMMILSNTFLNYATSGLPQMMMLFFFIWGAYFIYTAINKEQEQQPFLLPLLLSALCFSLVCLSGWIGLWPMVGFLIFVGIRFKPYGVYALPSLFILLLCLAYPIYLNKTASGSVFGSAFNTICSGLIGDTASTLRVLNFGDIPISAQTAVTTIIKNIIAQGNLLYENMGHLPFSLIFLIALLHTFKRKSVNQFKWAVFTMWVLATIGMALYTPNKEAMHVGQIQILFAPFFTAFGMAFILNLIARHSAQVAPVLKGCVLFFCLLITALPLLLSLPQIVKVGILTAERGIPAWPPYYPQGITNEVRNQTKAEDFILTDQPEAIAWYADRKVMDFPKKVTDLQVMERILSFHAAKMGSILVSPKSTLGRNIDEVQSMYGDFTPLLIEGDVISQTRTKDPVYLLEHSRNLAELNTRFGQSDSRVYVMGAELILYKNLPIPAPESAEQ